VKVVVTGGRDFADAERLEQVLSELGITHLATGGAKGADELAERWARKHSVPCVVYHAEWTRHGKRAGILRNIEMLKDFVPEAVVAFPGGKGTAHCVSEAQRRGISVLEFSCT
jgi:predicted Rossmann-fold nucleotide-binding protein